MDYIIITENFKNQFEKAPFKHDKEVLVYFAISKKSAFAQQLPQINKVMEELVSTGEVKKIIRRFYERLYEKN